MDRPFAAPYCPGAVYANQVSVEFHVFVDAEVRTLACRGCIVPWSSVPTAHWTRRPRLVHWMSVEPVKPWLIYDAQPLNQHCRHVPFTIDTVGIVTQVGWQDCFQGSLDDHSGFHYVVLESNSWSLFGFHWREVDYIWTTLPFVWNQGPYVYSTLSEAKARYLRRLDFPVLSYIDDSWIGTSLKSKPS